MVDAGAVQHQHGSAAPVLHVVDLHLAEASRAAAKVGRGWAAVGRVPPHRGHPSGVVHRFVRCTPGRVSGKQPVDVAIEVATAVGADGWVTVSDLLTRVSRRTIGTWVADGRLVRLGPGVLALPTVASGWRCELAAALAGREAVASHVTALALWELIEHPPGPVHATVDLTEERGRLARRRAAPVRGSVR